MVSVWVLVCITIYDIQFFLAFSLTDPASFVQTVNSPIFFWVRVKNHLNTACIQIKFESWTTSTGTKVILYCGWQAVWSTVPSTEGILHCHFILTEQNSFLVYFAKTFITPLSSSVTYIHYMSPPTSRQGSNTGPIKATFWAQIGFPSGVHFFVARMHVGPQWVTY